MKWGEDQRYLLPPLLMVGDAILEVNGERVKYAPVEKVVEAITRVPYPPLQFFRCSSIIVCATVIHNCEI